jgi:hypothetical protein
VNTFTKNTPSPAPALADDAAEPAAPVNPGGTSADGFVFDPISFLTTYPLALPIVLVALWIGAAIGWRRLTTMYNVKGQPLAPLGQTITATLKIIFKEDTFPVFTRNETLMEKFAWLTWKRYWQVTVLFLVAVLALGGYLPFGIGNYLLAAAGILLLIGVGHVRKVFAYRNRVLGQMFEVANGEMRYDRGASLNPWGYIQVSSWQDLYSPGTTAVMFPAKYRSEDARNRLAFEVNFNGTVSDQHAWSYTWESSNNRVICEPVPFIPEKANYPFPDRSPWDVFPLGLAAGGEEANWRVSVMPHLLIAGTTGSGKSVTQRTILLHALQSPDWRIVLVDPKMVELSDYRGHPNVLKVATELDESLALIEQVEQEMMSRYARMKEVGGVNHFRSLPEPPPAVLLMVDETFALLSPTGIKSEEGKEQDAIKARIGILLSNIARLGRAAGIHQVLATQRPDAKVLPGELKANLDARIAQGRMDTTPSLMTLDSDAATRLPQVKGRAILRQGNDFSEFQAYFLPMEHLPQVLEMSSAIAQGDTSFLDEPEPEPEPEPGFKMPSISFKPGSKIAEWVRKRQAIVEENELRAGRTPETRAARDDARAKSSPAGIANPPEAPAVPEMSAARSDVSIADIAALAASRQPTLDIDGPLIPTRSTPAASPAPDLDTGGAGFDPFESAPDDDPRGFGEFDDEFGYAEGLDDLPDSHAEGTAGDSAGSPVRGPGVMVGAPPPGAPITAGAVGDATASISVQEVMRKASERGVPIPASELLAALRAEVYRQQQSERPAPETAQTSPSPATAVTPRAPAPVIPAPPGMRTKPSSEVLATPTHLGSEPEVGPAEEGDVPAEAPWMPPAPPIRTNPQRTPFASPPEGAPVAPLDKAPGGPTRPNGRTPS